VLEPATRALGMGSFYTLYLLCGHDGGNYAAMMVGSMIAGAPPTRLA